MTGEAYDVIIVGAGSAGCVLSARLSEDSRRSVLLLEAGPDYTDSATLPQDIASGLDGATRSHDWGFHSEPAASGRTIHLPRGKLVGGCSATNALFALRGSPADYDEWAARNNPGWSFDEVLPFFLRLERDADYHDKHHGHEGPLPIRRYAASDLTTVQRTFVEACGAAGYPFVPDHNAPGAVGAGPAPLNMLDGIRQSTALTYLAPARGRANLTVRASVLVDRLVLKNGRAVGVRLAAPDETLFGGQIILAAGAYGTPALLLRSGLGPAEDLRRLGIDVNIDLPGVGRHLADHPIIVLAFAAQPGAALESRPRAQSLLTWHTEGVSTAPDLHVIPVSSVARVGENLGEAAFGMMVSILKPRSRGRLYLRSADPAEPPRIDPDYFSHPDDMPRMLEAVRVARRLARTKPLVDLTARTLSPAAQVRDTDGPLGAAVLAGVSTYHHPVGTCRMGPDPGGGDVVDPRGRVHGIDGLSVVDASIMPTIPAANTNVPTIMIAERCAAWLTNNVDAPVRSPNNALQRPGGSRCSPPGR
jgi:choline dehydrogenase